MAEKIVLAGAGGHAKVVIDAIRAGGRFDIYGIVDPALPEGTRILGEKVVGTDADLDAIFGRGIKNAFISIGSIGDCEVRKRLNDALKKTGFKLPAIVHPAATVAKDVELGEGTFVAAGVVVNPGTKIGKNAIINTSSSVDHDCVVGDFAHIAPGATLSGGVFVGDEAHIGTGANVIQGIRIGCRAMIGAGSTVRQNIADRGRYTERVAECHEKE